MVKIAFLGDSITEGYGASCYEKCYVKLIEKKLNCKIFNYGVGGTQIARVKEPSIVPCCRDWDFQQRAYIMPNDVDKVFVFGGTNDFGRFDTGIGEFQTNDPYTFRGGLSNLIKILLKKYDKEKICFILPLHRINEVQEEKCFTDYITSMRKIITEYKIDILDLYQEGLPAPIDEQDNRYFIDGLHPNDLGYKLIADKICDYLLRNYEK